MKYWINSSIKEIVDNEIIPAEFWDFEIRNVTAIALSPRHFNQSEYQTFPKIQSKPLYAEHSAKSGDPRKL